VVTGAGCHAQSEAQMHLSQSKGSATGVTCGTESADGGTGETSAEGREEIVLFEVFDARRVGCAVGETGDKEAS